MGNYAGFAIIITILTSFLSLCVVGLHQGKGGGWSREENMGLILTMFSSCHDPVGYILTSPLADEKTVLGSLMTWEKVEPEFKLR